MKFRLCQDSGPGIVVTSYYIINSMPVQTISNKAVPTVYFSLQKICQKMKFKLLLFNHEFSLLNREVSENTVIPIELAFPLTL
jgi:hypothetical protein